MSLSWVPPTVNATGSIIQYNVEVYEETCDKTRVFKKTETESHTSVQQLKAGSLYCIIVEATNTNVSTSDCYSTKEDKTRKSHNCHHLQTSVRISATTNPSPPTGLIVKHVDDSSVELEWRESTIPPGETLVNYVVEC